MSSSDPKWHSGSNTEGTDMVITEEALSNGTCDLETVIDSHCVSSSGDVLGIGDLLALSNDGISEISNSDLSLPEVCISTNSTSFEEDMNYEVQQAYRIFTGFLLDKHKAITSPFLNPIGHLEAQHGIGGVRGRGQAQLKQSMCLRRMEEKFVGREYETITEFVADFRLMLENCYRYHGVDHWISKQAQKLEIMLEQKLTLLSRTLREKTTLAVTSKGRFGAEEERGSGGTSTRRRSAPRSLATLTVGGHESIMVQALRVEEQQRAKEEKRQRELDKKEAEEMSAKEVEEWERNLLSQASPHQLETLWELPAIGHLLCLAQTALNLPEIVFFELERCLLMPRCSPFLSKVMSALLCPPQRRATLNRRPSLPYRRWESELRQRVQGWYQTVGASHDQPARAEQLGLCHQFFSTLGEVNPLEETPFHLLPFYQRVWLLKGLCDNVYETQKDVQGAVLAQPIHECRESILGYDSMENAYIHFPHFCGADLRIYCQSPSMPPSFPLPPVWVKRIEPELGTEATEDEGSDGTKPKKIKRTFYGISTEMGESDDSGNEGEEKRMDFKRENGGTELNSERFNSWPLKGEEGSDTETSDEDDSSEDSKSNLKMHNNSLFFPTHLENSNRGKSLRLNFKEESQELDHHQPSTLTVKQELSFSLDSGRTIKAETWEPCLSVGEHSYTGRSPARSENLASPGKVTEVKMGGDSPNHGHKVSSCLECSRHNTALKSEEHVCCCSTSVLAPQSSCESAQNSSEEKANDRMRSRKKKRKKGRGREQLLRVKGGNRQLQQPDGVRQCQAQAAKSSMQRSASTIKRKDERKQPKTGKKLESSKKVKDESPVEPSFKLVCTSLEELRRLISKTEDELDSLESTKKRAGRWYFNKESVKELHITLIRLLNELSPWEPKLVKAYQRNRLRLKKEFDDFRKHSDYNNFVREECVSSSSEEDEDNSIGGEVCSLQDHYRGAEEDDHGVPRSLWTGGVLKQFEGQSNDSLMTTVTANHLKRSFSSTDEDLTLRQRNHANMTTLPHSVLEPRSGLNRTDQAREGYSTLATASATQASMGSRSIILHPTIGLPKGYTPIPTLLAKSVGNKVTLMKRPADYLGVSSNVGQSKVQVMSQPSLMVAASECTRAQSSQSQPEQSFQQLHSQGPQKTRVHKRIIATATTALPKSPQTKPSHATLPKSPVQVVYKAPEGLGHLLKKDDNSQVNISVQSIMDQNTGEKRMQQVIILPSSLLIQKTEETLSSQQLHKSTQAPFSKVAGPLCMTTNVPGFTIPDSRIPVQQVAPLKDARAVRNPSPSVSPHLQQNPLNTASLKVAQASSTQANAPQTIVQNWSLATSPTSAVSTESSRPTDPKQELKTVCIRDSQSILVTTRGGNTGIVKVQTPSDQNAPGSLPPSPIITISPQFKAFLVSQTSPPCSLSAPSQTSSCTFPAGLKLSEVQPQQQVHSVTSSSTVTAPRPALVTGAIPLVGLRSQTSGSTVTFCHGDNLSPGPMVVSHSGQKVVTTTSGSQFPAPLVKNTVIVPSLSGSGNPLATTPAQCKLGVKCASTDERSQLTKLILVAPSSSSSSSSSSNAALHKVTSSSTTSLPCSRFVFISQSAGATTTTTTSMGCIAKQGLVAGAGGQPLTTSIPSEPVKMGISLGQPVSSNHSEVQSITLPTGVQIRLPGRTVSLGQAGGALPQSPKSTAVSISMTGSQAATAGMALVQSSNMVTSTSTSSHVQGVSSFTTVPQPSPPRSMAAVFTPPPGCVIKKDASLSKGVFATNPSAQVTTTAQMNPGKTTMPTLVHQSKNVLSVPAPATPSIVPRTPASTLKRASITGSTNPFSTSTIPSTTTAASTMQQRIVINTTTPLAAGTQILLNNTRFVVPPQGLGPGSHVLLISSPVTPPVPITSTTTTTPVKALLQGPSPMTDASRRPVIPASPPARLPNTPALGSSVVVGAPATGPTVLITTPTVTPLRLAGTPALSSPLRGATNVVSALPRLPAPQGLASPVSGTPTLVSALPLLASTSTLISPVITSAPDLTSVLPAVQLPAGTSTLAQCSPHTSTLSALAVLPRLTAPPLSSPILPTTSAVASISPGTSTLAPLSSAELAGLPPAPATQQTVSVSTLSPGFPHQLKTLTLPASSTAMNVIQQASLHTGPTNTSIKHQVATVMQPILACTRTQLLPTVAVPPIASTASRMQSLPIATVTPIGSTLNSLQASPVAIVPPSNTTVLMTPAQPNRELKTHEPVCTPIFLTNKALGKPSLQNSASAVHATIGSKLLISPDGAVLNTVQGPVNPAGMSLISPKPLATLVVSASSSSGRALPTTCTNNSTVQSAEGDISEPMN